MKKIITIFAAISMLAVSCQKENILNDDKDTGITTGKLTATMMPKTKVSYTYMDYDDDWNWNYDWDEDTYAYGLLPAWEVGDEIIGFDNSGNTYTLTVDSIDADGVATLSGTVPDGDLHLIYKYGAQASDISNKTLTVDYSDQAGDAKSMPAVMLADGTVENGGGNFTFTNAGAIISIWYTDGLPAGSKVTNITISGKNLSEAIIALDGSELTLTATENTDDAITFDGLDLTVIEEKQYSGPSSYHISQHFNRTFWIAVPAGAVIEKVSIDYFKAKPTPVTDPAKEGADYVTIAGKKWAKWNIGAVNEKDYGWYFYWGGTENFWLHQYLDSEREEYKDTWWTLPPTTSYDFVYDIGYEYTACASTYIECSPEFETTYTEEKRNFNWESDPYNNGEPNSNNEYFNTEWRDIVCPGDVLAPAYDAAHVYWGSTWRMPTKEEFLAMKAATYWAWDATDKGYYVYTPDPATDAGKINASGTGTYSKSDALLFFPAAGLGTQSWLNDAGSVGRYWSSTLYSAGPGNAESLQFDDSEVKIWYHSRPFGFTIRPVSD